VSLEGPPGPDRPDDGPDGPADPNGTTSSSRGQACGYTSYDDGEAPDEYPKTGDGASGVEARVWAELYEVEDPEMPVSVVDLGLIYDVEVVDGHALVEMTLTYSGCPARDMLQGDIHDAALRADGVEAAEVDLRYSPAWNVSMVSEDGKDALREFGLSV